MRVRRPIALAAAVVLVGGAGMVLAEDLDVPKLFDSAKASFAAQQYGKCLGDLQMVLSEVGRMRTDSLKAALPGAPAGWTADEAEGQALGGWAWLTVGTNVKRSYRRGDDTNASLDVNADAGALMMGIQFMFQNAAMLPAGSKMVTVKGRKGILEYRKDDKSGSLTVLLKPSNSFLKLEARGVTSEELADKIPAGWDLDALERAIEN